MSAHPYVFLALFLAVAVAFPLVMLTVAKLWFRIFQPGKPSQVKQDSYECGVAPTGDSWIQFKAHYYLYAILFLIFDVEVLFLLPFAVAYTALPAGRPRRDAGFHPASGRGPRLGLAARAPGMELKP